ncbi:MAG: hypothetical protein V3V11_03395 [Vicinamibacteria bacterium]
MLEGTAGAPKPLKGKIRIGSDQTVRYKARVSERWIQVNPNEGSVPGELEVSVDASELPSGTHFATVTVESSRAERPVDFKIEVELAKGRLKFQEPAVRMEGTFGEQRVSMKVPLETHPLGHRFPWRARVREPWLEVVPEEGRGPVELEVIARLKEFGIGEFQDTVIVESDDATNPARLKVFVRVRPRIAVSPNELKLECEFGSSVPLHTRTALSAIGAKGLGFRCSSREKWIKISPVSGNLPAELDIAVDPSGKELGEHHTDVLVESPQAKPIVFRISLKIRKPKLKFDRADSLAFECNPGSGKKFSGAATVLAGKEGEAKLPIESKTSASWLSAQLDESTTPARLHIQADPSDLASGHYEGKVVVVSEKAEAPVEFKIRLKIRKCRLTVDPKLTLHAVTGETDPSGKIRLQTDPAGLGVKWSVSWTRRDIFHVEPRSGTGPAEIRIGAKIATVPVGSIQDDLKIESRDAEASANCRLNLRIAPKLRVEPAKLEAECIVSTPGPALVWVRIAPLGQTKLTFTCRSEAAWVKPIPADAEAPSSVRIELDPAGRPPGIYRSHLTFESGEYQTVRIPITLKIRKTRLAISRQKVMVEEFAGLSRPAVEKVSVTTSPAGSIEFAARSNASWLWCTPETGRTDAELVLQIDGTKLGSGSHRGRIMISSEQAEEPVPIDVTLLLKKIRLQVPGQIELIGTTADDRISGRLKLDAEPPDHSVRWKAKWTGSELELNPREGKIPAEIEIVAKTKGRPAGKRRIPVIFESDDAEAPARLSVSLTLYEAGSPHAEIFPEFYRLQRAYRAWAATLTEAIPRLASEDPISGVRHLEAELPALQERAAQLQTASQHFRSTISRLEERLRKEGLEAEARKLSERARSMEYRVDSYTGETAKIISGTSVMTLKIQGEARWHTTGLQVRKGDVLFVTAKGRWTGSPEWPWKGPGGEPVERGEKAQHCLDPTLPFFALLGSIGEGGPFLIGEERFLLVTEEGEGPLKFRPNYRRGEHRGEMEIRVLRLRLPWNLRRVFADVLGPLSSESWQYRRAVRRLLRGFLAGNLTAKDLGAMEQDLLANYPQLKESLESRLGEFRRRLAAEGLRQKLAIPE